MPARTRRARAGPEHARAEQGAHAPPSAMLTFQPRTVSPGAATPRPDRARPHSCGRGGGECRPGDAAPCVHEWPVWLNGPRHVNPPHSPESRLAPDQSR
jgi:hypothetical protein